MTLISATPPTFQIRRQRPLAAIFGLAVLGLLAMMRPAQADAIDGDWCFSTQNLNIQGSRIRIPSGVEMTGAYTRHSFQYTVPGNEPEAGTSISLQLFSETHMQLTRAGSAPETWQRCKPVS